jgi:hypothetical protein
VLKAKDGFAPVPDTELALLAAPEASPAARRLAALLIDFCNAAEGRAAA